MESFINTTAVVAFGEMGDKTNHHTHHGGQVWRFHQRHVGSYGRWNARDYAASLAGGNNRAMVTVSMDACSHCIPVCCNGYMDKYLWTGVVSRV